MRIHSEYMTVQTEKKREFMNITPNVKSAMEKSGLKDGIILVAPLHSNSAVFINDDETGLLEDIADWLDRLAPFGDNYRHAAKGARAESNAAAHMQGILLNQQAVLSFTDGKLEMGPWQQVIYAELDGMRPKRIHIKLLGE
jgi:secondary thiamine-phosphate synthase enzyme